MAKLNPIFGRMRGKLGGAVYYSANGKQCVRERVTEVANPRSSKQAIQRAIFATLAQFSSAFSPVLNNAVEGLTGKTRNLSKLNAYNLGILRRIAAESLSGGAFTPKGAKIIAPNEYMISRGSLRGISPKRDRDSRAALANGALQFADTDLVLSESVTASGMFPTITVGDQITILAATLEDYDAGSYSGYCRFAFKNDTTPALVVESGSIYKLNEAAIDLTKAAGPWRSLRFTTGTGARNVIQVGGLFGSIADEKTDLAGIIVSRESKRKRSTSYMLAVDSFPGYTLEDVYPTYMDGGTPIDMPSEVYLNNDAQVIDYFANLPSSVPYTVSLASDSRKLVKLSTNVPLGNSTNLNVRISRGDTSATLRMIYNGGSVSSSDVQVTAQWLSNGYLAIEGEAGDVTITEGTITFDGGEINLG